MSQENVTLAGHAIECRLTAEDPERNFLPMPGRLLDWECPEGEGIRVDTHCFPGYSVPPFYDSLLAKVITKGEDREEAVQRMKHALGNFVVRGIHTVIPFLLFVLNREEYRNGDVHTNWMESVLEQAYSRK